MVRRRDWPQLWIALMGLTLMTAFNNCSGVEMPSANPQTVITDLHDNAVVIENIDDPVK